jgi:hypothetical protein
MTLLALGAGGFHPKSRLVVGSVPSLLTTSSPGDDGGALMLAL